MLKSGTPVIYVKQKCTTHPGPNAQGVHPAAQGDTYNYVVPKMWVVVDVMDNGQVLVQTRRGKTHLIDSEDPRLRAASWWERLYYRHRFPKVSATRN